MIRRTKGTIESDLANALGRFQREQCGRGPADVRAFLVSDMVIIRSRGIFTPTEERLASSDEGKRLIRSARQELRSIHRADVEEVVADVVRCGVLRSYANVDVDAGEQLEAYILAEDVEKHLLRQDLDRLQRLS